MKRVIVFTGSKCQSCHAYIAKLLKHEIKFTEVSTDTLDGALMAAKHHVRSLPTTIIGGTSLVGNVPINKIMEALKNK